MADETQNAAPEQTPAQITLPDVFVTPDNAAPNIGPGSPSGSPQATTVNQAAIAARMDGHSWPAINNAISATVPDGPDPTASKLAPPPLEQFGKLPYSELHLDPKFPTDGVARPFAPGEYMRNPDGSWSSEMSNTVEVNGKPSVVPGLWLMNGQPTHLSEDQAAQMAQNSGLQFKSFPTEDEAEKFSEDRENSWQNIEPGSDAQKSVESLWTGAVRPGSAPPTPQASIDWSIGALQDSGMPVSVPGVEQTQSNMVQAAQNGGMPMDQMYRAMHTDPLLQDAMTSDMGPRMQDLSQLQPAKPSAPTLDDLSVQGLDKIDKSYFWAMPFVGAGEMGNQFLNEIHDKGLKPALEDAAANVAIMTGLGFAGKYVAAPAIRWALQKAQPAMDDLTAFSKELFADQSGSLGNARLRPKYLPQPPSGIAWTAERGGFTGLEDELNRLNTNTVQDRKTLAGFAGSLPPEWRDDKFQEDAFNYHETKLPFNSTFKPDDKMEEYFSHIAPLQSRENQLAIEVDKKLHGYAQQWDPTLRITDSREGYVHRMSDDQANAPTPGQTPQPAIGVTEGARNTTTYAQGMQERQKFYALDDQQGNRVWGGNDLDGLNKKYGDTMFDPVTDKNWTLAPATTKEIEANGKWLKSDGTTQTPAYVKNYQIAVSENVARLSQVNRNLDFLGKASKELEGQGAFIPSLQPAKATGYNFDGSMKFESAATPRDKVPPSFKEVNLPGLSGWAEPRVADALNQYHEPVTTGNSFLRSLRSMNSSIMRLLFMNPLTHGINVTTQYFASRSWSNFNPMGYGSMIRHIIDAYGEVANNGPRYAQSMRDGAGLQRYNSDTQNFLQLLHTNMLHGQSRAPWFGDFASKLMSATGTPFKDKADAAKQLINAQLDWSHRTLWMWNDVLHLARQFDLQEKGMPVREAMFQAEKDIANYRVPSQVMGSEAVQRFLTDPAFDNFGRYHYGLMRSAALMARDLLKGSTGDKMQALGKVTSLAFGATAVLPLLGYGMSTALSALTGSKVDLEMKPGGLLSPAMNLYKAFTAPQDNWLAFTGSLMSFNPVLQTAYHLTTGLDVFGNPIWANKTPMGKVASTIKEVGNNFYPFQIFNQSLGKDGMTKAAANLLLHMTVPIDPAQATKWQKKAQAEAFSKERHDGFENFLTGIFGGGPPPAKIRGAQPSIGGLYR